MSKVVAKNLLIVVPVAAFFFLNCSRKSESDADSASTLKAVANMAATAGNQATGTVSFTQEGSGVRVSVHFEGVPEGTHGFHIHEFGDCSSGDGTSAGGHFNPEGNPHAGRDAMKRHIGDLGNVVVDASGVIDKEFVDSQLRLEGPNSIMGKGVILHADADDLTSQPTGAAGARISCGVVKKTE